MSHKTSWLRHLAILFSVLFLSGCVAKHTPTPPSTPTVTFSPSVTPSLAPATPTPQVVFSSTPTSTPAPTATPTPTSLPRSSALLGVSNVQQITALDAFGKGAPLAKIPAVNGQILIVKASSGFYIYDKSFTQRNFIAAAPPSVHIDFSLSEDSRLLAVTLRDYSVQVWDIEANQLIQTLTHKSELPKYPPPSFDESDYLSPRHLRFSPDNRLLAVGYGDGDLEVLNIASGETIHLPANDVSPMPDMLGFSADGSYLASASVNNYPQPEGVAIWSLANQKLLLRIPKSGMLPPKPFSPDNKTILTYSDAGVVYLWDAINGNSIARYGTNLPAAPEFSPDGKLLLINGGEQVRRVSDGKLIAATPTPVYPEPDLTRLRDIGHIGGLQGARWSDDQEIMAWGADTKLYTWQARSGLVTELPQSIGADIQVVGSHNGMLLAFCAGRDLMLVETPTATIKKLSTCLDSTHLAVSSQFVARGARSMLDLISISDGKVSASMRGHLHPITSLNFSPDNAYLASGSEELASLGVADAFMWQLDPPQRVLRYDKIPYIVRGLAISPDNSLLAFGYGQGNVRVLRVEDAYTLAILDDPASVLAFSPDASLLATGSYDGKIKIYDSATWQLLVSLPAHAMQVIDLAFSPDGYHLMSASSDGTIRIWGIP